MKKRLLAHRNYLSMISSLSNKPANKIMHIILGLQYIENLVLMTRINCMIIVHYTGNAWERSYRFIHLYNMCLIDDKKNWKTKRNDWLKQGTLIIPVYSSKAHVLNNWKSTNCFHDHWVRLNAAWLHTNIKPFTPFHNHKLLISVRYCQYRHKTY